MFAGDRIDKTLSPKQIMTMHYTHCDANVLCFLNESQQPGSIDEAEPRRVRPFAITLGCYPTISQLSYRR